MSDIQIKWAKTLHLSFYPYGIFIALSIRIQKTLPDVKFLFFKLICTSGRIVVSLLSVLKSLLNLFYLGGFFPLFLITCLISLYWECTSRYRMISICSCRLVVHISSRSLGLSVIWSWFNIETGFDFLTCTYIPHSRPYTVMSAFEQNLCYLTQKKRGDKVININISN